MAIQPPLLSVEQLSVAFGSQHKAVDNISFVIYPSETFALVGESGSGKSLTALSVLRLLPANSYLTAKSIVLDGQDLMRQPEQAMCKVRGRRIGLVFQDPMSSLNPVMSIGAQIAEAITQHFSLPTQAVRQRVLELMAQVEIPQPAKRYDDYPHQLSGGQRQRVMIAIALAGEPDLLIADEPTTSLDVTIQAQILALLKNLQQQSGMALWLISHDLALVSMMADRIAVMQRGKIVETGVMQHFFSAPQHPYTQQLLNALPSFANIGKHRNKANLQAATPVLQIEDYKVYYPVRKGIFKRITDYVRAVDGVSFSIAPGKTLALVGESGCGKTTLGKSLLNLLPSTGRVLIDGVVLGQLSGAELRQHRTKLQIIFQDPFSSMNPRMLVGDIIAEGLRALRSDMSAEARNARVLHLLEQVGLPESSALRYPHEFSGGQRQRICIARALAVGPKLIVCDEPTSALDVSVQAQIIRLLQTLQEQQGISYLFITHDLAVVAEIADEVAVMFQGKIVELGEAEQVLKRPQHAYTQRLLMSVPHLPGR